MLCIKHSSTDPYFNIATDEYIFKHIEQDCFMLWRNDNAIIVGKHQNTLAEINLDYVREKDIKVVRRLSGGGAVYHDLGNLNFTFTRSSDKEDLVDFRRFTEPILEVLRGLDINARFEGRNDLTIDGKKFSGNAMHVVKNKSMHHGTLLFSSEMKDVSDALKINPLKYKGRGTKSVPSRVTNISDHLKVPISLDQFTDKIMNHILETNPKARLYEFSEEELEAIQSIRDKKYATWEWNFGRSPDYNFQRGARTPGGIMEINLEVQKGVIQQAKITGDFFHIRDIAPIEAALVGTEHDETAIKAVFDRFDLSLYFKDITSEDILEIMF
ncbi:MAG: lipoate--protein ligase [Saprospirales bacterium]|nr:MAG: lipoate--protein ligase [Saprospirales bacterium]